MVLDIPRTESVKTSFQCTYKYVPEHLQNCSSLTGLRWKHFRVQRMCLKGTPCSKGTNIAELIFPRGSDVETASQ